MNYKHGHARKGKITSEYWTWARMLNRCYNLKCPNYHRYGGRGIRVCPRWRVFANFYADMGRRPAGRSLDRKDNNKSYSPSNCHWATRREQALNRKQHKLDRAKVVRLKTALRTAQHGDKTKIARRFNVSPQLISDIIAGRAWAHVT